MGARVPSQTLFTGLYCSRPGEKVYSSPVERMHTYALRITNGDNESRGIILKPPRFVIRAKRLNFLRGVRFLGIYKGAYLFPYIYSVYWDKHSKRDLFIISCTNNIDN